MTRRKGAGPSRGSRWTAVRGGLAIACLLAGGVAPGAQSQSQAQSQAPPVFRAEAALVELIVGVTDRDGRFVPGLSAADFEVRDEGRLQTIVAFDARSLPRSPALAPGSGQPPLERPDMSTVATNENAAESRLFVFFLDDLGTPPSHLLSVRRGAREFLERYVAPTDFVAVFPTSGRGAMTQEFTRDKTRVLAAVDQFMGSGNEFGGYASRIRADVAEALARHLAAVRGRRVALIWFSAGALDESEYYGRRALDALREVNATVYVLDPRRLYDRDVAGMMTVGAGMAEEVQQAVPRWGERPYGTRPDVLRDFAEKTGGFAAVNTNDFDPAYDRILDENSRYYVLGFQPSHPGRAGESRRIQVRVRSRPDLRVSTRSRYSVPSPDRATPRPGNVPPALADALVSSIPSDNLPLRVQAIVRPVEGGPAVDVVVEVPGRDLPFRDAGGRHHLQLDFAYRTIDRRARSANNQTTSLTFTLTDDQLARVRETGLRWIVPIDLTAGGYSFRLSGQVAGSPRAGVVFGDIDVPAFEPGRLWIGGLALTSPQAALAVTAGTPSAAMGLPEPPTTSRRFTSGDTIAVSAATMVPAAFSRGTARLEVHALDAAAGPPRLKQETALPNRAAAERLPVWTLDTGALGPGRFVLRVTLEDDRGQEAGTALVFDVVAPERK